jgi:hypothetical protein
MKPAARPNRPFDTPAVGLAAFACALPLLFGQATAAPQAASQPATVPAASQPDLTAAERYAQLAALPKRSPAEAAEYVGLHFILSVGVGDGANAAHVVDEIGYQPLPVEGPLWDDPPRAVRSADLAKLVAARPDANVHECPMSALLLLDRAGMRALSPGVADWMLPGDFALVAEPRPESIRNWVQRPGCVVVRVRGSDVKVLGGSLFDALSSPPNTPKEGGPEGAAAP